MEIVCPACGARFALKVAKVPTSAFKAICGKCKQPFVVDPNKPKALEDAGRPEPAGPASAPAPAPAPAPHPDEPPAAAPRRPEPPSEPPRRPEPPSEPPRRPEPPSEPPRRPEPAARRPESRAAAEPEAPPPPAGAAVSAPAAPADGSLAKAPVEEFSDKLRLAMLCDSHPERVELLSAVLADLGYRVHVPPSPREPLSWVQQNRYDVMLVHEEFGGGEEEHAVLAGLNRLQIAVRRLICVGLLGPNLRTMDNMTAFHRSVNFVMSDRDIGRARSILRSAIADNDEFYRVFKETMKAIGKT